MCDHQGLVTPRDGEGGADGGRVRGDWQKVIVGGKEEESSGERYRQDGRGSGSSGGGQGFVERRTRGRTFIVFTDLGQVH